MNDPLTEPRPEPRPKPLAEPRAEPPSEPAGEPPWMELARAPGAFWVFGYGSLMWDPGFPYRESLPALLRGYHRGFCVYSLRYRGTPEAPGLVLGLDRGGSCRGIAYRVDPADRDDVLAYLWEREMFTHTYRPRHLAVRLAGGDCTVQALTFVVNRTHTQYAGKLPTEEVARLIAAGEGTRGRCHDYLMNTVRHLHALGLSSPPLTELAAILAAPAARRGG